MLDAFFVGRALAEVVNEKVGSALGEILSEVRGKGESDGARSARKSGRGRPAVLPRGSRPVQRMQTVAVCNPEFLRTR